MENINNKDKLQIIKNNKLKANIYTDDENLFSFDAIPINNVTLKNHVFHRNTVLWHARLGHYDNKNIQNFVIEHLKLYNLKIVTNAKSEYIILLSFYIKI